MNIVIPDPIEVDAAFKQKIHEMGAITYDTLPQDDGELIARIKNAELITANYIDITAQIIDSAPNLKYIVVPAVGYEWVDVAHAASKGITVINCPTFNSQAVAEHALALLLAVARQLITVSASLRRGQWDYAGPAGVELQGKKMGLIGYGNIGRRVEKMVAGFGMQIDFVNSRSSSDDIDRLISESDVVCVCAPLTIQTRHMIDSRRLALLKEYAIVINVGRGAIIDQQILYEKLKNGEIYGAGLDVFEDEPLTGEPNEAIVGLANLANVVATPHMAYNTRETAERLGQELYDAIEACMAQNPIHVVS